MSLSYCALTALQIFPPTISEHGLVMATITYLDDAPSTFTRLIHGRRSQDPEVFWSALMEVPVVADPSTLTDLSMPDAFMSYESSMTELVDRFLPLHLVTIRRCPHSPWFDRECHSMRRQARRHERKYRQTGLPSDRSGAVRSLHAPPISRKRQDVLGR